MEKSRHVSVLEKEVQSYLKADQGGKFLDCTLGGGGHTRSILNAHPENTVLAIDRDTRALERVQVSHAEYGSRLTTEHSDFCALSSLVDSSTKFSGVLADLGLSTDQLFEERGFSFRDNTLLDMRMDETQGINAADIVNTYAPTELLAILRRGGVGNEVTAFVKAIVSARPFSSAKQLADVIAAANPLRKAKKASSVHPATVVFQALRIEVNKEFQQIDALLDAVPSLMEDGGRFVVISFHSLEDELVTKRMRNWAMGDTRPPMFRAAAGAKRKLGSLLTRKAVTASDEELERNPSSRSARLRAFEFGSEN